ncbi:MAG: hypothetical protein ACXVCO_01835 [Ktedonobacterales bacterium]
MNCPNCGLQITDPRLPSCPRCGQPLHASAPDQQPQSGMPTYPGYGAQPATPPTSYGVPPSAPSGFGDQAPYPGAGYGQPSYGQPPYGQPAGPSTPMYGQPAGPSTPMYGEYGQPAGPSTPYYGQGMPGGYPPPQPGYPMPQPPQRKRNLGLIIGVPVAIVLVLCIGGFAALAYIGSHVSTPTSTNPGTSATPGEQVLFQDALTSSSHKDGWPEDGNCSFASDGYHVNGAYLCYAPTDDVSNGSISVQVAQVKGDTTQDYGLVFRRASKGNYYVFAILSTGKWDFYKGVNNSASNVVEPTANSAIKTGLNAKNTLKVTMSGSHFTFFVNGVQVGTADDTSFTSGLSGVAGGDNIETVYTAYKVTK